MDLQMNMDNLNEDENELLTYEDYDDYAEGVIEAVLFACGEPVDAESLAAAVGCEVSVMPKLLAKMSEKYERERRGITIIKIEERYQLSTNKIYTENIRRCLKLDKPRPLSQTLLETLAVIAYMQPVTKQQITEIRGADASHAVNRLMEKGLVCEAGRHEAPGRPILFATTPEFLRKFGFNSVKDVPSDMGLFVKAENAASALDDTLDNTLDNTLDDTLDNTIEDAAEF